MHRLSRPSTLASAFDNWRYETVARRGLVHLCSALPLTILLAMVHMYRKTEKGQAEITTRANRLPPRFRAALIMVDGKRSEDELAGLIPAEAETTLRWLTDSGFIERLEKSANTSVWGSSAVSPKSTHGGEKTPASLAQTKKDAVRDLHAAVGPEADGLAMKIERAPTAEDLTPLLEIAHKTIGNARGADIAQSFHDKFLARSLASRMDDTQQGLSGMSAHDEMHSRSMRVGAKPQAPLANGLWPEVPNASRTPIDRIKKDAVRDLLNQIGPVIEGLAMKIERARSREELKPLLEIGYKNLANARGPAMANEFYARYIEGLMV